MYGTKYVEYAEEWVEWKAAEAKAVAAKAAEAKAEAADQAVAK